MILMSDGMDIKIDDKDVTLWLKEIEVSAKETGIEVIDELGDYTKSVTEQELRAIKRTGPLYGKRTKHLYEDVEKKKYSKGRTVVIQGGKETKSLWHIVNDGTYRSKPHHFIDRVLNRVEPRVKSLLDQKGAKLGD